MNWKTKGNIIDNKGLFSRSHALGNAPAFRDAGASVYGLPERGNQVKPRHLSF